MALVDLSAAIVADPPRAELELADGVAAAGVETMFGARPEPVVARAP